MRRLLIGALALALVALCQAALAANGDPQKRLTAADTHAASNILLTRSDLGPGRWKSGSGASAGPAACGIVLRLQPNESDLVETGTATGPLFSKKNYQALNQTVRVFASTQQANSAWTRTVTKNLVICMEQQVENTSSMGAPVSVTNWSPLKLPRLVDHQTGVRVTATASGGRTTSKVYFDLILLGRARTMTKLVFSSLQKPFPTGYEGRLARTVAQRLTRHGS